MICNCDLIVTNCDVYNVTKRERKNDQGGQICFLMHMYYNSVNTHTYTQRHTDTHTHIHTHTKWTRKWQLSRKIETSVILLANGIIDKFYVSINNITLFKGWNWVNDNYQVVRTFINSDHIDTSFNFFIKRKKKGIIHLSSFY